MIKLRSKQKYAQARYNIMTRGLTDSAMDKSCAKSVWKNVRFDIFQKWRDKVNKRLPSLAARVFDLRHKMYMGCGLHYSMEKSLGMVIARMNDVDACFGVSGQVTTRVVTESLFKSVKYAEKSANK